MVSFRNKKLIIFIKAYKEKLTFLLSVLRMGVLFFFYSCDLSSFFLKCKVLSSDLFTMNKIFFVLSAVLLVIKWSLKSFKLSFMPQLHRVCYDLLADLFVQ